MSREEHDPSNSDLSTTLPGVILGKTYTVEMTATNSGGESDRTSPCNVCEYYLICVYVWGLCDCVCVGGGDMVAVTAVFLVSCQLPIIFRLPW